MKSPKLFKDSISAQCRYGDIASKLWGDWELIYEDSEDEYSGNVLFLIRQKIFNRYIFYRYYYGSCSGCDSWEDKELSDEQISELMEDNCIDLNENEFKLFVKRINLELEELENEKP